MTEDELLRAPACFDPANIPADMAALADEILAKINAAPDSWSLHPDVVRRARDEGKGVFPLPPESKRARVIEIDGPHGPIPLRIIAPENPKGVYLHIHGGGWMLGAARHSDGRSDEYADKVGLAVVSVDYRLAPEFAYPQGPDDCEAAALWLVKEGLKEFGTDRFFIGGESAGAHLSVVTMVRLRDKHGLTPFKAANLNAGCYDLSGTPSVRNWGTQKLILATRDTVNFTGRFVADGRDLKDPDISPLYADVKGLPPALFTVGTRDLLMDDSLFMYQRWISKGNEARIDIYPGGVHVFTAFPQVGLAQTANARINAFLDAH